MTYVEASHPKNDVFRNIGCVISDTLEVARNQKSVERLARGFRSLVHRFNKHDERFIPHAVDDIVHLKHSLSEFRFTFDKRLEGATNHSAHRRCHTRNVDRQIDGGKFDHVHHTLGDVNGLVANSFEVGVDFCNGENEAKISCHGLLHSEKIKRKLINLAFGRIDQALIFEDELAA